MVVKAAAKRVKIRVKLTTCSSKLQLHEQKNDGVNGCYLKPNVMFHTINIHNQITG